MKAKRKRIIVTPKKVKVPARKKYKIKRSVIA